LTPKRAGKVREFTCASQPRPSKPLRYDRTVRYTLVVSIHAVNGTIDVYTPVRVQIMTPVEVTT
jgi:hypothetical protein